MSKVLLYVKGKTEKRLASASHVLINKSFEDCDGSLQLLSAVDTFQLWISYTDNEGNENMDNGSDFPKYVQDSISGRASSEAIPVIFWQIELNVYPFGSGIADGRAKKALLKTVSYDSLHGFEKIKMVLSSIKGYERGSLSLWYLGRDGGVFQFTDDAAARLLSHHSGCRDVFLMVDHASYSAIKGTAVFPRFGNFDQLCSKWQELSAQAIFNEVTSKPSVKFQAAVQACLVEEGAKPRWSTVVEAGYQYLKHIQPIFRVPPDGDYPETQRRSIIDPVVLVATAYLGASADLEVELWSDKQKKYPANVLGHGPLDYLCCLPGRPDEPALGKRNRAGDPLVATAVVTEDIEEEDEEEEEGDRMVITEGKTRKTVADALPQLLSQSHDSMLEGAGQINERPDPTKKAKRMANKRFSILSTGQRYYIFLLLWPDPAREPTVHYMGYYPLRVFPMTSTTRDSGAASLLGGGGVEAVTYEEYSLAVAAVVTCLKGEFAL